MRAHICWIFFENENLNSLIKNNENNENWPGVESYVDITDAWWKDIDKQWNLINRQEIWINKTRQLMADTRAWFINEYNLFKKPAKRFWLEKQTELKVLEKELATHQYNLDHPKEKLEEYEKRCLLNKIAIGKRKIGNCKDELKEAETAYETEKRELCLRLAYEIKDLEPFLREPEYWNINEIQQLLSTVIKKKGQPKTAFEWYSTWWKKYQDIHPPRKNDEPLQKLRSAIAKWQEHNGGKDPEENPYEIWVEDKTDDSLTFLWKLVQRKLDIVNDKGEIVKVEGQYLELCKNYFFNYYGVWYEVSNYQQVNYQTVAVICERSIFYNDYRNLAKSQANVIIHHAPRTIASKEICSCPNYQIYTSRTSFVLEYELRFNMYRLGKDELKIPNKITDKDGAINMIVGGVPKLVDINQEWAYITGQLFTDIPNPSRVLTPEDDTPGNRMAVNFISTVGSAIDSIGTSIKEFFLGKKSILYILLSTRLEVGIWTATYFFCPTSEEQARSTPEIDGEQRNIYFKEVGKFDNNRQISSLTDETKEKFLEKAGFLKDEMFHFLRTHIKASLLWRGKPVWRGNYWDLHNEAMIVEGVSGSGTSVTFEGSGRILGRVTELITARVGLDTQGHLSVLVTTATTIASAAIPGAGEIGAVASTALKAGVNMAGGMAQIATNELMNTPNYSEVTENMTISEFRHKFQYGKTLPISLELEFNQELANQYLNKRELKGPMLYTYKNLANTGDLLVQQSTDPEGHFLKASVISWNMTINSEWWRSKIEEGRFIYHKNNLNFYNKPLSGEKTAINRGGIPRGNWNEFVFMKSYGIKGGFDNISHRGGGFFVYKHKGGRPNYIRPKGGGTDFLPLIMAEMDRRNPGFINDQDDSMWLVSWPAPEFNNERWDIPNQYKNSTLENGERSCDIEFRLDFFSGGDESLPGERFNITNILVSKTNVGTRSDLNFNFVGENNVKNRGGNPAGIPPAKNLPTDPSDTNVPPSTPFNPNRFPSSGNLIPTPTGSGEFEPTVPDIDIGPDPDFTQDPDLGVDPEGDPTQDPDKPKDPDTPPDTPPDEDDEND